MATKRQPATVALRRARRPAEIAPQEAGAIRAAQRSMSPSEFKIVWGAWSAARLLRDAADQALFVASSSAPDRNIELSRLLSALARVDVGGIEKELGAQQWTVEAQNIERGKAWLTDEVLPMIRRYLEVVEAKDIKQRLTQAAASEQSNANPLLKLAPSLLWPPTLRTPPGEAFTAAWILASKPVLLRALVQVAQSAPESGKWPFDKMALEVLEKVTGQAGARDLITDLRRWKAGKQATKKRRSAPRK